MQPIRRLLQQRALSIFFSIIACLLLGGTWRWMPLGSVMTSLEFSLLVLFLISSLVAAGVYPIHIQYHTKIALTSVPLYVIAVLLPPFVAILTTGIGILIEQMITRISRGSRPRDTVTAVSRLMIVMFLGTIVAHLPIPSGLSLTLVLFSTAGVLFLSDVLTCALELTALSGEPLGRMIKTLIREGIAFEAAQYLLGIVGVFAALQQIWVLGLLIFPVGFVYVAYRNTKQMHATTQHLMESMADAVDLRDPYTGGHSRRVTTFCAGILREWPMHGVEADLILTAARVHDIGKIAIPDAILNKPGLLTAEERTIMESHAERGAEFLARYPDFARGVAIVRHHHERWDGKGYPSGLQEFEIPFGARFIAVADSFDAITSDRPYRRGRSWSEAAAMLREDAGQQWEPAVVEAFLRSIATQLEEPKEPARPQAVFVD